MKSHIVIPLCFSLAVLTMDCSKNDTPSMNVGTIYNPGNSGDKILKGKTTEQATPSDVSDQQLNNKLNLMDNDTIFQYALASHNQGKHQEALAAYKRILETDKNYPDIYYHQGILYRDMSMREEAICAFQIAVTQNPNSAEAHYNLGYSYRCKGLHSEAIAEYKRALELISEKKVKQKAYIHYNLGFSYFSHGQIDNAIAEFKNALAYKPNGKEIHQKLGIAYTAKGWADKAKDEFSISRKSDTAESYN